jgi:hypothetical protein
VDETRKKGKEKIEETLSETASGKGRLIGKWGGGKALALERAMIGWRRMRERQGVSGSGFNMILKNDD